jgi:mannose-6-phosphate isomerase
MLYPLTFQPIFKERVWGGRQLERLYQKPLPPGTPIGESWEMTDRPEGDSVIASGPLAGHGLRWLMEHHSAELLGKSKTSNGRFPLLVKILDANDKLSLQVHPPPDVATALGGEPKTEFWFVANAGPGAELYVGLKRGVSRTEFQNRIREGTVADCFHRLKVQAGDAMFLPSGRVHAIGAGLVIFEIQQNSDTTYRVFDWNRIGLDGNTRELHLNQSLASINFDDFEPSLIARPAGIPTGKTVQTLVHDPLFTVSIVELMPEKRLPVVFETPLILGVVEGMISVESGSHTVQLMPGQFVLLPACQARADILAISKARFIQAQPG